MDSDSALRKIHGLLRLGADDGATEAEAASALRFARRLILNMGMTEEEVRAGLEADASTLRDPHAVAADAEYTDAWEAGETRTAPTWEGILAGAMGRLVGTVRAYRTGAKEVRRPDGTLRFESDGRPMLRPGIVFYGPVADVVLARELFTSWRTTIIALARMRFGGAIRGEGRDYAGGFVHAMSERIKAMAGEEVRELQDSSASTTALVRLEHAHAVMRAKVEAGAAYLASKGVRLGNSRRVSYGGSAYAAGRADGARADIGTRRNAKRIGG
jgi:hypothetical protein